MRGGDDRIICLVLIKQPMSGLIRYAILVLVVWFVLVCVNRVVYFVRGMLVSRKLVRVDVAENGRLVSYYVQNHTNREQSAALLSLTRKRLFVLLNHLNEKPDTEIPPRLLDGVRRMIGKHCNRIKISELDTSRYSVVAFNQNKGQHIYLCLRRCPACTDLAEEDHVYIVAMHELAHSAVKSYERTKNGFTVHGPEFRAYERYLGTISEQIGIVKLSKVIGGAYCDITIPDFMSDNQVS